MVKTPEEAREIIQSLKVGSDFGSLAKERSLDQSTSQNGGQIPFTNIRNVLVPGLAEAILALQPGDLLPGPFKSKLGYHVVLLEEKREVPFPSYEEVKPKVLSELERLQTTEFLNDLQKDAKFSKFRTALSTRLHCNFPSNHLLKVTSAFFWILRNL